MPEPSPQPLPRDLQDALAEVLLRKAPGNSRDDAVATLLATNPEHATQLQRHIDAFTEDAIPARIGPFRILGKLGEGGFGTVYRAEQTEGVHRVVALKVLRHELDSRAILARFDRERRLLAALNHDGVARFHEAGEADGQPWFAMELVDGVPLTTYCDDHRLAIADRLRLFRQVCDGVQHAHVRGIVHRDLKPCNVLVGDERGRRVAKVIDFGIARVFSDAGGDAALPASQHTIVGTVLGTPGYMAPEQVGGDPLAIDGRADVYALGVMLYELLTGELPIDSGQLPAHDLLQIAQALHSLEPAKPSTKVATHAAERLAQAAMRQVTPKAWSRALRGDLDAILGKALEKDPDHRYQSVAQFSEDIRRNLDHEPTLAQPPTRTYRLQKFVRRYRGQVIATVAVLVTALAGTAASWAFADRAARESDANLVLANEKGVLAKTAATAAYQARLQALQLLRSEGRWHETLDLCDALAGEASSDLERIVLLETRMLGLEMCGDPAWLTALDELVALGKTAPLPAEAAVRVRYFDCLRKPNAAKTKRAFLELLSRQDLSATGSRFCQAMTTDSPFAARDLLREVLRNREYARLAIGPMMLLAMLTGDAAMVREIEVHAEWVSPNEESVTFIRLLRQAIEGEAIPEGALPTLPAVETACRGLVSMRRAIEAAVVAVTVDPDGDHAQRFARGMLGQLTELNRLTSAMVDHRMLATATAQALPFAAHTIRCVGQLLLSKQTSQNLPALDRLVEQLPCCLALTTRAHAHLDRFDTMGDAAALTACVEDCWAAADAPELFLPLRDNALLMTVWAVRAGGRLDRHAPALSQLLLRRLSAALDRLEPLMTRHPELRQWAHQGALVVSDEATMRSTLARWVAQCPEDPRARLEVARHDFGRGAASRVLQQLDALSAMELDADLGRQVAELRAQVLNGDTTTEAGK